MNSEKRKRVKLPAALVGDGAVVALGALTAALGGGTRGQGDAGAHRNALILRTFGLDVSPLTARVTQNSGGVNG
jgi:hypothetical protein